MNVKKDKKKRRTKFAFLAVIIIFISSFFCSFTLDGFVPNTTYAVSESEDVEELEQQIEEEIGSQLGDLDFSAIETYLENLTDDVQNAFSGGFVTKVESLINGEYTSSENFFTSVLSLLWDGLLSFLPIIASIIAISILGGMVGNLKPSTNGKSIGNIVHFVTYGVVIVFLGTTLVEMIALTTRTLTNLKSTMDAIFPILLTLLTAVGGTVSVSLYQPAIAMLGNVFISLITYFLLPLFIFSIIFSIVGNLSNNVKLDKFVAFLQGTFKWSIGLIFTLFLGFMTIQGISAGAVDGLSIRTAKYTIKVMCQLLVDMFQTGFQLLWHPVCSLKTQLAQQGFYLCFSWRFRLLLILFFSCFR